MEKSSSLSDVKKTEEMHDASPLSFEKPSFWKMVSFAIKLKCPNCGKEKLFARYQKQIQQCSTCHTEWGHIRADDGPTWLTLMVVGHIVFPTALALEFSSLSTWIARPAWIMLLFTLTLAFLPVAKALFIAMIWRNNAPGSEKR